MKKQVLTTIILLGMTFGVYAQQFEANGTGWTLRLFSHEDNYEEELGIGLFENGENPWDEEMEVEMDFSTIRGLGGGLFGRGENPTGVGSGFRSISPLVLPNNHGLNTDSDAPLGSGALLLAGFGAAYLIARKRKEEE